MVVATHNFFAPLRTTGMEVDPTNTENTPQEEAVPGKTSRPPQTDLTFAVKLNQSQKQLKNVASGNFGFRNTRNGTIAITRGMADFQCVKSYFDSQNFSYFSFFPKSENLVKAVISHLPHNTPAEDMSDGFVSLGFDVVIVKQMTTTCQSPPEESKVINLPLFLVTCQGRQSPRKFSACRPSATLLLGWRHIELRILLRSATTANSSATSEQIIKQPHRCLFYGGGHLHKECP
jgi:hypothetical protein